METTTGKSMIGNIIDKVTASVLSRYDAMQHAKAMAVDPIKAMAAVQRKAQRDAHNQTISIKQQQKKFRKMNKK